MQAGAVCVRAFKTVAFNSSTVRSAVHPAIEQAWNFFSTCLDRLRSTTVVPAANRDGDNKLLGTLQRRATSEASTDLSSTL